MACFWKYDYVKTNKYTESRMFMIFTNRWSTFIIRYISKEIFYSIRTKGIA